MTRNPVKKTESCEGKILKPGRAVHCPIHAQVVRGDGSQVVRAGILRQPCCARLQYCLQPLSVAICKRRTRLRADADPKKVQRSVEIGFPVDGKRLPLREALEVTRPFLIVLRVTLESRISV